MMSTRRGNPDDHETNAQRDLAGLLGGLLGGQLPHAADTSGQGGLGSLDSSQSNDVANLLGGLLGGGAMAGGTPASTGDAGQQGALGVGDLGGLLGGLLGGDMGGAPATAGGQQAQDPLGGMGGLLGGLLGGGGGEGLGGLLGGLVGSNQASTAVAQQTGLAPSLVQALLPMIVGLLARGSQRSNMRSEGIDLDGDGVPDGGDHLADVARRLRSGAPVSEQELRSSGATQALARHSGLSEAEVAPATLKIVQALSQGRR